MNIITTMSRCCLNTLLIKIHKYGKSVSLSKRHYKKLIMIVPSSKVHFWNVVFHQTQLVLNLSEVSIRKVSCPLWLVKQVIYT